MTPTMILTLTAALLLMASNLIKTFLKKRICEKGILYTIGSFVCILQFLFSPNFLDMGMKAIMPVVLLFQIYAAFELSLIFFSCNSDTDVCKVKISESYIISQISVAILLAIFLSTSQWSIHLIYGLIITMFPLVAACTTELTRIPRWLKKALYGGIMVALGVMLLCLLLSILTDSLNFGLNLPGLFKEKF